MLKLAIAVFATSVLVTASPAIARFLGDGVFLKAGVNRNLLHAQGVDPYSLGIGEVYRISGDLPLMPEVNPSDPMAALAKAKSIPAGYLIEILEIAMKGSTPWYRVAVAGTGGAVVAEGWVNSIALLRPSFLEPVQ